MAKSDMIAESLLDKYGVDITKKAEKGELDPCVGRTTQKTYDGE
jgi:ATP-dependent Clp protease ATP-binding subunit ClpA